MTEMARGLRPKENAILKRGQKTFYGEQRLTEGWNELDGDGARRETRVPRPPPPLRSDSQKREGGRARQKLGTTCVHVVCIACACILMHDIGSSVRG